MLALSPAQRPDRRHSPGAPGTLWMLLLLIASLAMPFAQPVRRSAPQTTARPQLDLAPTPAARPYALPDRLAGRPELAGRRTLNSATYELAPGRYGTIVDPQPLHYEAAAGQWEPIRPVFETRETGWINAANTIQTGVASNRSAAKVWAGELGVAWEPQALVATDRGGRSATLATPLGDDRARQGQRSADGGLVRYAASWSDLAVQDQWAVGRGESAYSLRLAERPQARGIAPATLDLEVKLSLLPGTTLQVDSRPASLPLETSGAISFVDGAGRAIELAPPLAFEQAAPLSRAAGKYVVSAGDGGSLRLLVRLPWAWFAADRQYPVIIDPVFQMRNGTTVRSPGYWGGYNNHVGDYGAAIGRYRDGAQHVQQIYLVKFALPTLPIETADAFPAPPTISAATLVATPVDGGTAKDNWASLNVQARALNSGAWTNFSAKPLESALQGSNLTPEWQPIGYSAGNPEKPTSAAWDVTSLVSAWVSNPSINNGIALFSSTGFCEDINPNGCAGLRFSGDRNWIDADLGQVQSSANPHQAFPSPNKTGGVRLVVEYAAPTLRLDAPVNNIASPTNSEPYYRNEHTYRLDPAIASPWVAVATRSLKPTVNLPPPTPPDGHIRTRTDTDLPAPFEVKHTQGSFNTLSRPIDGHNVQFIGVRNDFIQNNGTLIVSPSNALPANYQLDVIPQRGAVAGAVQGVGPASSYTYFTLDDEEMFNFWDLSLPSEPNVNTRVDLSIDPFYANAAGQAGTADIAVPDNELLPRFRASLNEISFVGQIFRGGGRADNPSPDNSLHSFELGPAAANTTYKLGLSYDGPQVTTWICVGGGEICTYQTGQLRFSVGIRITSCRPTAGGDATYPTSQGKCQIVACPTSVDNFHGAGKFGVWGAATQAGTVWTTTDGDTAPLVGINNNTRVPTVAAVGGRVILNGSGKVTIDATAGTPTIKLINCGGFTNPNTLNITNTFNLFNRPASSFDTSARLRPAALPETPWFGVWGSAADMVPDLRSSLIDVDAGTLVNSAQFSLAAGNADESAPLSADGTWSVDFQGWPSLATTLTGLDELSARVASMTLTGSPDYGFDVAPAGDKNTVRELTAIRINQATVTHKAEMGGASKPVKALIFPRNTAVPGASSNVCMTAAKAPLNCLDLRATDDTPSKPNRIWAMPDIHLELSAGSLVLQKPGEVRAFSTDHPMAGPSDISQNFSYDTFGASVSVTQEECGGAVVTVIRGETRLTLPNVGDGTSPDGVIAASFKLCGGALRQVHMEFKSPAGIPIGSTGFFLTGLSGTVDIMPDYTQIKFGIDFQAAQGGDGGLVKAHGEVTIDTRGLIGFEGKAKILSAIDAEGKVWVAWNPLDIGFDTSLSYGGWLTATSRGHLWKGQGWQNRYSWLPDNDETHLAAELTATITIGKGDIMETFILDIPPGKLDIKISLAFGQFCTNGGCTSYEWGIKGKFEILGYNVGLYYGFDKGLDFILGNDDHILIDQYGGAGTSPILRGGETLRHRRAARAIDGTASETFAVSAASQEALLAFGWRAGTPTLRLVNPAGESRVITLDNSNAWAAYGLQAMYTASASDTSQQIIISLDRPASGAWAGDWTLEIGGLSDTPFVENYQLLALTNKGEPGQAPASDYRFTAPAAANEPASPDGRYTLRWSVPPAMTEAPSATISLFYTFAAAITGTVGVSVPIRANLPFSAGQYEWDMRGLAAGSYSVFAQLDDGFNDLGDGSGLGRPDDTCQPQATWVPPARAFDARRFPGVTEFIALGTIKLADSVAPPVPTGLSLTPTAGALLARWDAPGAADRDTAAYNVTWGVYESLANKFTPLHNQRVTASQTPTLRLGALTTLSNPLLFTYAARVEAIDSTGNTSAPSAFVFGHPLPDKAGVPFQPLKLSRVASGASSVTLRWDENPAGPKASAYQITASRVLTSGLANKGSYTTLVVPDPAPASYNSGLEATLGGLETGAVYSLTVTARDSAGWNSAAATLAEAFVATSGADGDGDGLPDDWAAAYGVGGSGDSDGDGLSNAAEFGAQTNPARQDSDGDGFSDYEELTQPAANDTDPRNSLSYPDQQLQPRLQLDRRRVTFRINKGDAPELASLNWHNPVAGTSLILQTSDGAAWLDSAVTHKWVPGGGDSGTIQLAADASQLAPGFYSAVVRVDAGAASQPLIGGAQCVLVNLFVSSPLGGFKAYLPRLDRAAPQADLRGAISLAPSKLSWKAGEPAQINVTITNHGTAPTAPFWADLYINPSAPPAAANQPWYDRCGLTPCFGMAWQVSAPIPPGGSVTLSSTAGSTSAGHTIWPGWFANGTSDLYLYVDSWNPGVAAGAIAEPNEADNLVALHGLSVSGPNPALADQPDLGRIQPR